MPFFWEKIILWIWFALYIFKKVIFHEAPHIIGHIYGVTHVILRELINVLDENVFKMFTANDWKRFQSCYLKLHKATHCAITQPLPLGAPLSTNI
jgi:hypothetical protein